MVSDAWGKSNLQIGYLSLDNKSLKMQFIIKKCIYRLKEMNFAGLELVVGRKKNLCENAFVIILSLRSPVKLSLPFIV